MYLVNRFFFDCKNLKKCSSQICVENFNVFKLKSFIGEMIFIGSSALKSYLRLRLSIGKNFKVKRDLPERCNFPPLRDVGIKCPTLWIFFLVPPNNFLLSWCPKIRNQYSSELWLRDLERHLNGFRRLSMVEKLQSNFTFQVNLV